MANDKVGVYYVLKYVVEKYKSMNINFKAAALVYPCSPLLRKKDILNSYKLLKKNKNLTTKNGKIEKKRNYKIIGDFISNHIWNLI